MSDSELQGYKGWAIVEIFGHKRTAGFVAPVRMYGAEMMRIEIPGIGGAGSITNIYGGSAIYRLCPCDEKTAIRAASVFGYEPPMSVWEWENYERRQLPAHDVEDAELDDDVRADDCLDDEDPDEDPDEREGYGRLDDIF